MINELARRNRDLKHKLMHKKKLQKQKEDNCLRFYKLRQSILNELQEEAYRDAAYHKTKNEEDDPQDRKINEILIQHQNNLKGLYDSIFVGKEVKFKEATDSLHSRLSELESRRSLDKIMKEKFKKTVKKYKSDEEGRTKQFYEDYQRVDYLNNMHNPYYVPPIAGMGMLSEGNALRRDVPLVEENE